jgi:hypothetical protein
MFQLLLQLGTFELITFRTVSKGNGKVCEDGRLQTMSFCFIVASLGSSMTNTPRSLKWAMGTPGIIRSCDRSRGCWTARMYRCLFVSPSSKHTVRQIDKLKRWTSRLTNNILDTKVLLDRFTVIATPPLERLCQIRYALIVLSQLVQRFNGALSDHCHMQDMNCQYCYVFHILVRISAY